MQELPDLSLFHWDELPNPTYFRGMKFHHIRARRSYRMRTMTVGTGVDDLLAAESLCEVQLLHGSCYLRQGAPFLSLEYVLSGELLVRQHGKGYRLGGGELFLMQPELESEFRSGEDGCHKISVMVVGSMLQTYLHESGLAEIDVLAHLDRHRIERLLHQLETLADAGEKPQPEQNALLTFELLQYLRTPSGGVKIPKILEQLRDELEEHPGAPWTRTAMAEYCNCTPPHLTQLFRRYFDTTPHRMLMDLRIRRARKLLEQEELSVKEISESVGYPNALNFSTEFRKQTGMSPRDYRKHLFWIS